MAAQTASISKGMDGDKLYQERARQALPILVRQASYGQTITYQQLANELGMPNPRNLNFVLGAVGLSLLDLGKRWCHSIPPIQCLVVNQADQVPGEGIAWFMPGIEWDALTKRQKAVQIDLITRQVSAYPRWAEVLHEFNLQPAVSDFSGLISKASAHRGGGESDEHRALKRFIAGHPTVVGLQRRLVGQPERRLPSGDSIDVFFETGSEWIGVEVKPAGSNEADITRGLFQCIKYEAVLKAQVAVQQLDIHVRCVLVLGGRLSDELSSLRQALGVQVLESVVPTACDPTRKN